MAVAALLVILVAVATYTDLRWRRIYNKLTYPGILAALALNAAGSLAERRAEAAGIGAVEKLAAWREAIGWVGLADSAWGLVACGGSMVLCYVLFRIGGGDVKLLGMIGAFLGLDRGVETLLWTFVVGAGVSLVLLIWRVGAWRLVGRFARQLSWILRIAYWGPLTSEERRELEAPLFLAPQRWRRWESCWRAATGAGIDRSH